MTYLSKFEIIGGWYRCTRLLYVNTSFICFNYGSFTANKLFWRFYWLTDNKKFI